MKLTSPYIKSYQGGLKVSTFSYLFIKELIDKLNLLKYLNTTTYVLTKKKIEITIENKISKLCVRTLKTLKSKKMYKMLRTIKYFNHCIDH